MIYLGDTKLPENKFLFLSLTNIYGIGLTNSNIICKKMKFSKNFKTNMISKRTKKNFNTCLRIFTYLKFSNDL